MIFSNGVLFDLNEGMVSVNTNTICIEFGFSVASVINSFRVIKSNIESDLDSLANYLLTRGISHNDVNKIINKVRV